ncbi:MAG: hypothetical protein U0Z44_10340 [Kouleothrix sp.]
MYTDKRPKTEFVLASIVTMFILHGNTKQFWPKIPYLSLRDEGVGEHTRLIFSSFTLVTLAQLLLGRLPRAHAPTRRGDRHGHGGAAGADRAEPEESLRLRAPYFEIYNFALVLLLPLATALLEDATAHTIAVLSRPSRRARPRPGTIQTQATRYLAPHLQRRGRRPCQYPVSVIAFDRAPFACGSNVYGFSAPRGKTAETLRQRPIQKEHL